MEIQTDGPFRLYSKTRGKHFSASGKTINTISLCSENHEGMEVKCGELSWSVTVEQYTINWYGINIFRYFIMHL
jgi:hypothetical protein